MNLVGIDIGIPNHYVSIVDKSTDEVVLKPICFTNNSEGFDFLLQKLDQFQKNELLIGMEDTDCYHFAKLKFLLKR